MQILKDAYAKLEGVWQMIFHWVGDHPKTSAAVMLALALANFARKY